MVDRLLSDPTISQQAAIVVNLIQHGSSTQRRANERYGAQMLAMMAEADCGPIHLGPAAAGTKGHDFDQVAIVQYPSIEFFADMLRSRFFQAIVADKQLGDTQAVVTVPVLDRL